MERPVVEGDPTLFNVADAPTPPYPLPEGWRWVRLGEVCLPTERRDPTKTPDLPLVYVDIASVDNTEGTIVSPKELMGRDAPSRARKVIKAGDVLFATTRPYLKNIALVGMELDNQVCSTGFCVLRANQSMTEPTFLFYLCRSDLVVTQLQDKNMRGASYPAVTDSDVLDCLIPLPPLAEQRRIVTQIDRLMERIREARRLRAEAMADADRLMPAALAEVFPHPASPDTPLPEGWRWVRLGEVCSTTSGGTPSRKRADFFGGDIPWVKSGELEDGVVSETEESITLSGLMHSNAKIFPRGTLLMAMYGATVGKLGILGCDAATNQAICAFFPDKQILCTDFLFYSLLRYREDLVRRSFGGAQPNISQVLVRGLNIPLPPLAEQQRIVAYLDAVRARARALKKAQEATQAELHRLEQAILERAFRGEL